MLGWALSVAALLVASAACSKSDSSKTLEQTEPEAPGVTAEPQAAPVSAKPGAAFNPLVIDTVARPDGYDVRITVSLRPGTSPRPGVVRYTAEPLTFSVEVRERQVEERDILGTGLAYDLNGDGDTEDRVSVACDGDSAIVDGHRLRPSMTPGDVALFRYADRPVRLGDAGAHAMLYAPCKAGSPVTFGLSDPSRPIDVATVGAPALQILIVEAGKPGTAPGFDVTEIARAGAAVDADVHLSHIHEPLTTSTPAWHLARWFMLPLDPQAPSQQISVRVLAERAASRLVIASIQESAEDADRARSNARASALP